MLILTTPRCDAPPFLPSLPCIVKGEKEEKGGGGRVLHNIKGREKITRQLEESSTSHFVNLVFLFHEEEEERQEWALCLNSRPFSFLRYHFHVAFFLYSLSLYFFLSFLDVGALVSIYPSPSVTFIHLLRYSSIFPSLS